jgi:hypothetical protein
MIADVHLPATAVRSLFPSFPRRRESRATREMSGRTVQRPMSRNHLIAAVR